MKVAYILMMTLILNCMSSVHHFNQSEPMTFQEFSSAKKISSDSEQFVFLWFASDTNYVEEAVEKLNSQCPDGKVDQIGTTFKTKLGFLSWTNQLHLVGYCRK